MSDKKKLDDEIGQELEDRLDDSEEMFETEEDFTVKVHREDYTVKRRFYDKGKAIETADMLRKEKGNVVEDNFEHDFETPVSEEDDVDWDKLMDDDIGFFPPISDAAEKKLEDTSDVADELAAESARVGSQLDKTMTMGGSDHLKIPIEKKDKEDRAVSETDDSELEIDMNPPEEEIDESVEIDMNPPEEEEIDMNPPVEEEEDIDDSVEIDMDPSEEEIIGESVEEELMEDDLPDETGTDNTGQDDVKGKKSLLKIALLVIVVASAAGLYYFSTLPQGTVTNEPAVPEKTAVKKKVMPVEKTVTAEKDIDAGKKTATPPPETKNPQVAQKKEVPVPEVVKNETATVEAKPVVVKKDIILPEVTKHYPYTIHISSYKSSKKADSEVERIRKKGYDAFAAAIEIPGKGVWRRIYTDYFETYTAATKGVAELKKKLREDAVVAKRFFGVQIGSVAEKKSLKEVEAKLREKGYTPYYLPVSEDGKYVRLLAGAYKKKENIQTLLDALKKDGFEAEIVKR